MCIKILMQALVYSFKFHVKRSHHTVFRLNSIIYRVLVSAVTGKATHVQLDWFSNFLGDHNSKGIYYD